MSPLHTQQVGTHFKSHWSESGFRGGGGDSDIPVFLARKCPDGRKRLCRVRKWRGVLSYAGATRARALSERCT